MAKSSKKPVVKEPVQVYLTAPDRLLLDRVAKTAGLSRAEVLRRGLKRMGAEVLATESPMLRLLQELSAPASLPGGAPSDVAANHDALLAEWERERWSRDK